MDFFFNIFFGPETTEARTESENEQALVNSDGGGGGGVCVVA